MRRAASLVACALALAAAPARGAELAIALRAQVVLHAATATLGDVAELDGDPALVAACRGLAVQDLPDLATCAIDAGKVRSALAGRVPARALSIDGVCALSRAALTIDAAAIDDAVRADLARTHPGEREIAILREPGAIVVPDDAAHPVVLSAESLAQGQAGELPYRVRAVRAGAEVGRALVVAKLRLFRAAPVAAHAIRKGDALGAADIRVDRVEIVADETPADDSAEALLGRIATRDIADGAVLTAGLVRVRPAVRAGQRIALVFASGAFEIATDGTALADAAVGDVVQARRDSDKRLVEARVTDDGRALVNFK